MSEIDLTGRHPPVARPPVGDGVAVLSMHTSPLTQPGRGDSGGMNVYVRELSGSLARAGVPVTVYVRADDHHGPGEMALEPGLDVVHLEVGPPKVAKADLGGLVDRFADAVGDHIVSTGRSPVLHANYWLSGVAGHRLKHDLGVPLVSTFHTLGLVKDGAGDPEPLDRVEAERGVIGCSDVICASNPVEAAQLVDLYGADLERVEMVPPGVDRAFFSPGNQLAARSALGLPDGPLLLFVGRIQPLKGLCIAIEAFARGGPPDATLVVVGGPSGDDGVAELEAARRLIAERGVGRRVRFVEPQPHHSLSTYYRAADLCLVPSRSESFGLVALEAAASGIPVVATDVGGLRTVVVDGLTGVLVADRDPASWAEAIAGLLDDRSRLAEMGAAAASHAGRFNWSVTAGRLRRLYADLAAAPLLVTCS